MKCAGHGDCRLLQGLAIHVQRGASQARSAWECLLKTAHRTQTVLAIKSVYAGSAIPVLVWELLLRGFRATSKLDITHSRAPEVGSLRLVPGARQIDKAVKEFS